MPGEAKVLGSNQTRSCVRIRRGPMFFQVIVCLSVFDGKIINASSRLVSHPSWLSQHQLESIRFYYIRIFFRD